MIAVIGATGYLGRSLARKIAQTGPVPLALFARDPAKLARYGWPSHVSLHSLETFDAEGFSLVINAIGVGDPKAVANLGNDVFDLTRVWDDRVLSSLGSDTAYVFLSSGAVYGQGATHAVAAGSVLSLPVNRLDTVSTYTLAKLCAEARHRCLPGRAILDLRVFGFADPTIDQSGSFFLSELSRAVATRTPFMTSSAEMVRDYAGADELYDLIQAWRQAGQPNRALDLYTLAPVSKQALLEAAGQRFGLEIIRDGVAAEGVRPVYASQFHAAGDLGYRARRTSLQVVLDTLDAVAAS